MLEFPLCSLSYQIEDNEKVGMIISYCIVEQSKKVQSNIHQKIRELKREPPSDFEDLNEEHSKIVIAADEFGISISNIEATQLKHHLLFNHIKIFTQKYGKDAFCRIGKKFCFETKDGKINYNFFAVHCAIQSILGKTKPFCRITKDRIRYRMYGFKSKEIAFREMNGTQVLSTDRQLGRIIDILYAKKFFSKFTYAQRQTYYSTRLSDEELRERVKQSKIYMATKRAGIEDKNFTADIKATLKLIRLTRNRKGA